MYKNNQSIGTNHESKWEQKFRPTGTVFTCEEQKFKTTQEHNFVPLGTKNYCKLETKNTTNIIVGTQLFFTLKN